MEAAVFAFQYSLPVICVDACTIKCPHVSAVLMTATFETTDGRLLTMCYGTAPSESNQSWSFFLLNLRQALQKYCHSLRSYDQVVFMSDRHKGILNGVSTHFPSSKHLYCIFHLLLNLSRRSMRKSLFFDAVEAINQRVFFLACSALPHTQELSSLMRIPEHWSRFAIYEDECKRYGVRTNNWAESQNNALMKQRSGPVLFVLLNAFKYTTEKVSECRTRALSYRENPTHRITPFAQDIYCSNKILSKDCILQDGVGEKWRVMEKSNLFEVDASNMDSVTCTCHRFFDEGIPCQHIILVLRHLRKENLAPSLIDHIYDKSLFELAFPDDLPFSPDDMDR